MSRELLRIAVTLDDGRQVAFEIAATSNKPAYFVLGVRKSGSSVLNSICHQLADNNGVNYVDVGGIFFEQNISVSKWREQDVVADIITPGNLYGGFRDLPTAITRHSGFESAKKVFMVRDPRDALVSEYYSNAFSHKIPSASANGDEVSRDMMKLREAALRTSIDEYVLESAESLRRTLEEYCLVCRSENTLLIKYEAGIMNKSEMIRSICNHFDWTCDDDLMKCILKWADVMPHVEDTTSFIRKVTPGDYKVKLSISTIDKLNDIFVDLFKYYNYQ